MRTRSAASLAAMAVAVAGALACRAGGSASTHPSAQSRAASATPVRDPSAHGTTLDVRPDPGVERVTVKLARGPDGGIKVLEFLSPDLTDAEKDELRAAIERGEARPEYEPERPASIWTTTVIRRR
ncbi:hypothetical protein [Anaeromyxobacter oryzae]|nr:hypothetical protein [Anaeromyxobacter oryzae]